MTCSEGDGSGGGGGGGPVDEDVEVMLSLVVWIDDTDAAGVTTNLDTADVSGTGGLLGCAEEETIVGAVDSCAWRTLRAQKEPLSN